MSFPIHRPRRLRQSQALRDLTAETCLSSKDLVQPFFVLDESKSTQEPIESMPGQSRLPVADLVEMCKRAEDKGIGGVMLFGLPNHKDEEGSPAFAEDGVVQTAIHAVKKACPTLLVMSDVCLCQYTTDGHCGLVKGSDILNDETLSILSEVAVSHAKAGSDVVAPSDMMDGRIGAIRLGLDDAGFAQTPILSYAAKYASAFYGPFRDAADGAPGFGDRRTYQMDFRNAKEGLTEMAEDLEEGADMLMVKPAMAYLDVLSRAKQLFDVPMAAYQVSGEYSMIKAAAEKGWLDEPAMIIESLTAIKRAGADFILTYFALDF